MRLAARGANKHRLITHCSPKGGKPAKKMGARIAAPQERLNYICTIPLQRGIQVYL